MENKICCLFGYREFSSNQEIETQLKKVLIDLIENSEIEIFYLGGKGSFDEFCAIIIYELKAKYKIKSYLVLAYLNEKKDEYDMRKIERLYDGTLYPPIENVPLRFAIQKRNEWMVNTSSYCVFYLDWSWGGAYKTYEMAKRKQKPYKNIGSLKI